MDNISADEERSAVHKRIKKITPLRLPARLPSERPHVVLIGGQQAAGKTTTQRLVHNVLGVESTASYDGDDNAKVHPRYEDVMRSYGRDGQRVVQQNLPEGLHGRCLEHLRAGDTKYDVVASHPLQREEWAKSWVDGFREHGYRVSVVYIATNESNSLLGIADRYQSTKDRRGYGRWVAPEFHDHSYAGVPEVAHRLETEDYVDSIYVVDRDGYVLHENHRGPDGRMAGPARAREVITSERDRPPTQEEREFFDRKANALLERDPNAPPERRHPDPVDEAVHSTVREALRREHNRPAPAHGGSGYDSATRIDQRLRQVPDHSADSTRTSSPATSNAAFRTPASSDGQRGESGDSARSEPAAASSAPQPGDGARAAADKGAETAANNGRRSQNGGTDGVARERVAAEPAVAGTAYSSASAEQARSPSRDHPESDAAPAQQQVGHHGEAAQHDDGVEKRGPSEQAQRSREVAEKLRQVNRARRERREAGESGGAGRDEGGETSREPER